MFEHKNRRKKKGGHKTAKGIVAKVRKNIIDERKQSQNVHVLSLIMSIHNTRLPSMPYPSLLRNAHTESIRNGTFTIVHFGLPGPAV